MTLSRVSSLFGCATFLFLMFIVGCGESPRTLIEPGMTKEEVKAIMGNPTGRIIMKESGGREEEWSWSQTVLKDRTTRNWETVVTFRDGVVIGLRETKP